MSAVAPLDILSPAVLRQIPEMNKAERILEFQIEQRAFPRELRQHSLSSTSSSQRRILEAHKREVQDHLQRLDDPSPARFRPPPPPAVPKDRPSTQPKAKAMKRREDVSTRPSTAIQPLIDDTMRKSSGRIPLLDSPVLLERTANRSLDQRQPRDAKASKPSTSKGGNKKPRQTALEEEEVADRLAERRTRRQKKAVIVQDRTRPTSARLRSASRKRISDEMEPAEVKKGRRASTALTRAVASVDQYKPQAKLTKSRMTLGPAKLGVFNQGASSKQTGSSRPWTSATALRSHDLAFDEVAFVRAATVASQSASSHVDSDEQSSVASRGVDRQSQRRVPEQSPRQHYGKRSRKMARPVSRRVLDQASDEAEEDGLSEYSRQMRKSRQTMRKQVPHEEQAAVADDPRRSKRKKRRIDASSSHLNEDSYSSQTAQLPAVRSRRDSNGRDDEMPTLQSRAKEQESANIASTDLTSPSERLDALVVQQNVREQTAEHRRPSPSVNRSEEDESARLASRMASPFAATSQQLSAWRGQAWQKAGVDMGRPQEPPLRASETLTAHGPFFDPMDLANGWRLPHTRQDQLETHDEGPVCHRLAIGLGHGVEDVAQDIMGREQEQLNRVHAEAASAMGQLEGVDWSDLELSDEASNLMEGCSLETNQQRAPPPAPTVCVARQSWQNLRESIDEKLGWEAQSAIVEDARDSEQQELGVVPEHIPVSPPLQESPEFTGTTFRSDGLHRHESYDELDLLRSGSGQSSISQNLNTQRFVPVSHRNQAVSQAALSTISQAAPPLRQPRGLYPWSAPPPPLPRRLWSDIRPTRFQPRLASQMEEDHSTTGRDDESLDPLMDPTYDLMEDHNVGGEDEDLLMNTEEFWRRD